jgi:hypothetical protein
MGSSVGAGSQGSLTISFFLCVPQDGLSSQQIDKEAKAEVDDAVTKAKASPEPLSKDLWMDIYYKGTEPPFMRGREREEVCCLRSRFLSPHVFICRFIGIR